MQLTTSTEGGVFAGIASYNSRSAMLERAVASLLPQVDHLGVYLNNYDAIPPFLEHRRVSVALSQDHGDVRDNGKFFFLNRGEHRFYVAADDDIIYPDDYVRRMHKCLEAAGPLAAVGVHGSVYPTRVLGLFKPRQLFHFAGSLPYPMPVHVVGTGTVMFDQSTWKLRYDEFGQPGMADVWFAKGARERSARLFVINRGRGWLVPIDGDDADDSVANTSLYTEAQLHGSYQSQVLTEIGVSSGGLVELVDNLSVSDRFVEQLSLTQAIALDSVRKALGWESADAALAERLQARLNTTRAGWLIEPPEVRSVVDAYSRATVGVLSGDVDASTAIEALDCLDRCAKLATDDREAWRGLPHALRFDSRDSRLKRCRDALVDLSVHRSPRDASVLWPQLRESSDTPLEYLVEAQRAGIDIGLQFDDRFIARGRRDWMSAAISMREYLEAAAWSTEPEPLAWRRAFGDAFGNKEVQLLLAVAAARSGSVELATSIAATCRHRWPLDLDVELLEAALTTIEHGPGGTMPVLSTLDRVLMRVGVSATSPLWTRPNLSEAHWLDGFGHVTETNGSWDAHSTSPDVSVIMTVHNDGRTVKSAVRSVLAAARVSIELVIVDDASTDGTAAALAAIDDARVRVIRNDRNLGPYVSRNRGLAAVRGDLITVADADDWSHPDRFAYQAERLWDQPELLGCTVAHIRLGPSGEPDLENHLLYVGHGPVSLMFRRRLLDHVGGFDYVRTRGDIEFIRRVRSRFGAHTVGTFDVPLILASASPMSNSKRFASEVLRRYRGAANGWHSAHALSDDLYVDFASGERAPFVAPQELVVDVEASELVP